MGSLPPLFTCEFVVLVDRVLDEKKKKKKKKKKTKDEGVTNANQTSTPSGNQKISALEGDEEMEAKPSQVRTFPNGLVIEELSMGKPDGKKAAPGKQVTHYLLYVLIV